MDKNLYLVSGTRGSLNTDSLYVLADNAGDAEQKANKAWAEWAYDYKAVQVKLVASHDRYGAPAGVEVIIA